MARLSEKKKKELAAAALEVRKRAYTPFSGHAVGAALLAEDGSVFTGCNIENSAYSPTICAERAAFAKAVSEGFRKFTAIAVAGGFEEVPEGYCAPCGVCRQVMSEFCTSAFEILMIRSEDPLGFETVTLDGLLPFRFTPEHLEQI